MKYKLIVFLFFSVLVYSQKVEIIKKFEVVNSIYDGTQLSKTEIDNGIFYYLTFREKYKGTVLNSSKSFALGDDVYVNNIREIIIKTLNEQSGDTVKVSLPEGGYLLLSGTKFLGYKYVFISYLDEIGIQHTLGEYIEKHINKLLKLKE